MLTRHRIIPTLLAFALLGGPAAAMAQAPAKTHTRTIDKIEAVTPTTQVTVENLVGHVEITQGGERLAIHASVVAGGENAAAAEALANTIKLAVNRNGDQLTVHVDYPVDAHDSYQYIPSYRQPGKDEITFFGVHIGSSHSRSSLQYQDRNVYVYQGSDDGVPLHVDLVIQLPKGLHATLRNHVGMMDARQLTNDLTLRSDDGDIHARAIRGKLAIHTGDGDVRVDDLRGDLDLHTGDGDVHAGDIQGDNLVIDTGDGDVHATRLSGNLTVSTGDGDIRADTLQGKLDLHTGDGDVNLREMNAVASVRVESGDGDITLSGDLSGLQGFDLQTGNGDVRLSTPTPPAVHLDIHGSDIHVNWPDTHNVDSGRHHYHADVGAASGNGRISTGSGDVSLSR